jgi:hypothetical protein
LEKETGESRKKVDRTEFGFRVKKHSDIKNDQKN